jgi:chemotaxis receptor (MCP) glutamine deamidase CheD
MLPEGRLADQVFIDKMIEDMLIKGANQQTIRARLVGGADLYQMKSFKIGRQNIHFVRQKMRENNILIQSEETGGRVSRTARLDIKTGSLVVNTGKKYVTI